MTNQIRSIMILASTVLLASALSFADDGGATYKAKCAMCHGATGTPNPAMAKAMGIKATTDPEIKALSVAQIEAAVKSGKGKMKPVAGLTDAQVTSVATYFKSLTK